MFVSDFLSYSSSQNEDEEPIPYLMDTSLLDKDSYITQIDNVCQFDYKTNSGLCNQHSFPLTRSQAKLHKVVIPSLFKADQSTTRSTQKASILRDPPADMASKRSTALPPLEPLQTAPKK